MTLFDGSTDVTQRHHVGKFNVKCSIPLMVFFFKRANLALCPEVE